MTTPADISRREAIALITGTTAGVVVTGSKGARPRARGFVREESRPGQRQFGLRVQLA